MSHVLWALRGANRDALAGLNLPPGKFRLEKWIPQQAVLAHAAIGAAVLHCGGNGFQEALYYGAPVLCLPYFADQFDMGARLAASGAGLVLDPVTLNPQAVADAVARLTRPGNATERNPFQQAAQRAGKIFRSYGGVKRAADFVEHIAEFGLDHLIVEAARMSFLVRTGADVTLFYLALGTLSTIVLNQVGRSKRGQ
ncbi:hypothetical protein KFL_000100050 [Klebsormidium nitens]|uniref:UDP-glycosyltransferases domain-containing protein n=1 Tax=Klebsormidium nitens TaxID=105231 RepID=A0A1Y1HQY5_KLENI|nr:hypothetical protein KFL_000100050 [Klebsormidium nitens]|eukprot:GAQ78238.1 hypothetical protein KFL_000100050 [Klebsormidium nitens]